MNTIDLKGRTAVVTGGARGIGFAAAQKLLASGAAVALWDVDQRRADQSRRGVEDSGRVYTAIVDVTDEASIGKAVDALIGASRQDRYSRQQCRHHRRQRAAVGAQTRGRGGASSRSI